MRKIEKGQWTRLQDAAETLRGLSEKAQGIVARAREELDTLAAEANEVREEAHGILDDAVNEAQDYYNERSEKWMESYAGSKYQDWIQTLESAMSTLEDEFTFELEDVDSFDDVIDAITDEDLKTPQE